MTRHRLTEEDNNGSVDVKDGDLLVIELPELSTAGYSWQVEHAPEGMDVTFMPLESDSGAAGAASRTQVVATVRIASPGELVLRHRQPWSPEPGDRAFRVSTRVNR